MRMPLCVLFVSLVVSCAPPASTNRQLVPVRKPPINVKEKQLDTLVFGGVDFTPFIGARVGMHHDGLLKIPQYSIAARQQEVAAWTATFRDVAIQHLSWSEYPVIVPAEIFANYQDYSGARFVLAGRVTRLDYNSYGSLAGNTHTLRVRISWELFDAVTQRLAFSESYSSNATARRDGSIADLVFRDLMSQLLADDRFVQALVSASQQRSTEGGLPSSTSSFWRRTPISESELVTLSAEQSNPSRSASLVDRVADGVVSLTGSQATGSAFVITRDGLALTNHHVVAGQRQIVARLRGGQDVPVRVLRTDAQADVALIEILCNKDCITLDLSVASPGLGTEVYAVGTPLSESLTHTVTRGIVSALRRKGPISLIQTDAAVNPGNSGGPLVASASGHVVGIVSSKVVSSSVEGIAFAVSIEARFESWGFVVSCGPRWQDITADARVQERAAPGTDTAAPSDVLSGAAVVS